MLFYENYIANYEYDYNTGTYYAIMVDTPFLIKFKAKSFKKLLSIFEDTVNNMKTIETNKLKISN